MLIKVPHFGYVLTDSQNLPRFWASAWALLIGGSLASSTLKLRLRHIEAFYRHAEDGRPQSTLDNAIADQNLALLEELLESYFITLRNVPDVSSGTEQRWRDAVEFVRTISERLLRTPDISARLADITLRLERLDRLYGQLRVGKKSTPQFVRALPAAVLSELFELVVPGAKANPFKSPATQWRVYCTFLLLLNAGLRRGETLTLRADFLKSENSPSGRQFWLNVQTFDEEDSRHSSPSIKTVSSIRQIPVSRIVAEAFYTYSENYRGRQKHSYFLTLSHLYNRNFQIAGLLQLTGAEPAMQLAERMAFSAAIAALESFLYETMLYWIDADEQTLKNIVKGLPEFREEKYKINLYDIFDKMESLKNDVKGYMQNMVWHNWKRVVPLLRIGLAIKTPSFAQFDSALLKRHDIVHRSGHTKDGEEIAITREEIKELCSQITAFAAAINEAINVRDGGGF